MPQHENRWHVTSVQNLGIITRALALLLLLCTQSFAAQVHIAAASNFTRPLQQLAEDFQQTSEHTVKLSFGSSGKLLAQIVHGAPFDLFLSADLSKPVLLINKQHAIADSLFIYAQGQLVLWRNHPQPKQQTIAETLSQNNFRKLAYANPRLAPYGQAAVQTLKSLGLWQQIQPKLVMGENITQTWQFTASGNAELGFIARSQIQQPEDRIPGSYWLVPDTLHQPIQQGAVILNRAKHNPAAEAFWNYLKSKRAQHLIQQAGYLPPSPVKELSR